MADDDEPDDHVPVPKKSEQSVTNRNGKQHQTNCKGWLGTSKKPYNGAAHHILPVTCFNPIEVKEKEKVKYIIRCVKVSKWDINGGNRFPVDKETPENNMVRLPLFSAYKNTYPTTVQPTVFKRPDHPENQCMHNSRFSEHHLYNDEVRGWLQDNVWDQLQENKEKHKGKGKDIKKQIENGVKHFRKQLGIRGNRETSKGNKGTVQCWVNRLKDDEWTITFSMASDDDHQTDLA